MKAEVGLEILSNLADKSLERRFSNEQVRALLVFPDFAKRHCTRAVAMGLLDAAGGGGGLAGSLQQSNAATCRQSLIFLKSGQGRT